VVNNQLNYNPSRQRFDNIDVAKAILIMLVVVGHATTGNLGVVIYWFHMPAFFFISGLVSVGKRYDFAKLVDRTRKLLLPYLSFGIVISLFTCTVAWYSARNIDVSLLFDQFYCLIKGGRALQGSIGIFWFINVLIVIKILFYFLQKLNIYLFIAIVVIFYVVSQILSVNYGDTPPFVIWNVDAAMLAMVYFTLGYYSSSILPFLNNHISGAVMILIGTLLIILQLNGEIDFNMDIKYLYIRGWIYDLFIPLLFTGIVMYISTLITKLTVPKILVYIGMNTQIIMYLHLVSNKFITLFVRTPYHYIIFLIVGVVIPLIILQFINQSTLLKKVFLGKL
jgi:polysaccharide biosynthesis protein PslL